jgi:predicted nucleic acid-binding protein
VGTLILDVSVLIGLLDTADAHHEQAVNEVEASDTAGDNLLVPASAYSEALADLSIRPLTVDSFCVLDVNAEAGPGVAGESLEVRAVDDAGHVERTVLPHKPERRDVREAVAIERGQMRWHLERQQRIDLASVEAPGTLDHQWDRNSVTDPLLRQH